MGASGVACKGAATGIFRYRPSFNDLRPFLSFRDLMQAAPPTAGAVLSLLTEDDYSKSAQRAGAAGYSCRETLEGACQCYPKGSVRRPVLDSGADDRSRSDNFSKSLSTHPNTGRPSVQYRAHPKEDGHEDHHGADAKWFDYRLIECEAGGVDVVLIMTSDSSKVRYGNRILLDCGFTPLGSTIEIRRRATVSDLSWTELVTRIRTDDQSGMEELYRVFQGRSFLPVPPTGTTRPGR
jgi:hypothetical protein